MRLTDKQSLNLSIVKAFEQWLGTQNCSLSDEELRQQFVIASGEVIETASRDPIFLHGQNAEAMFGALAASLGEAKLVKQEDGSAWYVGDSSAKLPDYRLVLRSGEQFLVEVKNHYQRGAMPCQPFRAKRDYIRSLRAYADLVGSELKFALYWARWNFWTLLPLAAFKPRGQWMVVDMERALQWSEMAALGDLTLGTRTPLGFHMDVRELSREAGHKPGESMHTVRVREAYLTCGGQKISDRTELAIAWYIMLFGQLEMRSRPVMDNDEVVSILHEFHPAQPSESNFEMAGTLSSMFSRYYQLKTWDDERNTVSRIHADVAPGALGNLVPDGYKGKALPLWIFKLRPNQVA